MSTTHAMSKADAAWLHMDRPTNLMVINSVHVVRRAGRLGRATQRVIRDRLVAPFDRFRQRPVDGATGPHWEDVELDLELHVHHVALPAPGDRRALEAFVSDRGGDAARPLSPAVGGLFDRRLRRGRRGAHADAPLHRRRDRAGARDADADRRRPGARGKLRREVKRRRPAARRYRAAAMHAGVLRRCGTRATRSPRRSRTRARSPSSSLPGSDPRSAIKGDQRAGPPRRLVRSDRPPARQARRTSARRDGQRRPRERRRRAPSSDLLEGESANDVHALVPFNLRPLDEPLPRDLGNRFGLVLLELPVGIEDPVERTAEVKRRMDAIKHGHEGAISYGILELMGHTPAAVEARLIDYFSAKGSMVLTNVPGPRTRLSVAGTRAGRRARLGAVLGEHRYEREHLQLRREGDGRVPHRRRPRPRPAVARRRDARPRTRARAATHRAARTARRSVR